MTKDFTRNPENGQVDKWDSSPYHTRHINKYVSSAIWTLCISLRIEDCLVYPEKAIISSRTPL
jgi:hypothetical protein